MRQAIALGEHFFNDGHWYVLSSTSLGGSGLGPAEIAERLQSDEPEPVHALLSAGTCLPLCFPGDCAMDSALIVVGDLREQEDAEWIARVRARIEIPCGEFMLMAGGMEEFFEDALETFEASEDGACFEKVRVEAGSYLLEVYAYVSSMTVNFAWEEIGPELQAWWESSRPGEALPAWLNSYLTDDYVDSDELPDLVSYIVRLAPSREDVPLPPQGDSHWVEDFEVRRPELCPRGLSRASVLADEAGQGATDLQPPH